MRIPANELKASLYRYTFMDTDMNQYLIFKYASTVVRKMTAYQLCCAGLARSPFVLTEHISSILVKCSFSVHGERASLANLILTIGS